MVIYGGIMKKNNGKSFENWWKSSVPDNVFFYRFRDSSGAWGGNNQLRFTPSNIADNLLFFNGCLFLNELKSHKGKSIPLDKIIGNKTKEKQIDDLYEANQFYNIFCNIIVFFSDEERCFALDIENFLFFMQDNDRKSIPIEYFESLGREIKVKKLRNNYRFDIKEWLGDYK